MNALTHARQRILAGSLSLAVLLSSVPAGPAGAAPERELEPTGPKGRVPITVDQDVILDHLPVTVIYEPPGPDGQQRMTSTQRFATKSQLASIKTESSSSSTGTGLNIPIGSLKLKLSMTSATEDQFTFKSETGRWQIRVDTSSWQTWANTFPARGDVLVFFLRPKFRLTWKVGTAGLVNGELVETRTTPELVGMQPIKDQVPAANPADATWVLRAATMDELRTGTGNGQGLSAPVVNALVALDPFWPSPQPAANPSPAGPIGSRMQGVVAPLPQVATQTGVASGPGPYPTFIQNLPARFRFQGDYIQWAPCGAAHTAKQSLETGASSSETTTHTHTTKVTYAATLEENKDSAGSIGVSRGSSVTWTYQRNAMTEQSLKTDAEATLGGGGECPADAPLFQSERWYDLTMGTMLFPTRDVTSMANVQGSVVGQSAGRQVIAVSNTGKRVQTATDPSGTYRLSLEPGSYQIFVQDGSQRQLSQSLSFTVPVGQQGKLQLGPLSVGGSQVSPTRSFAPAASFSLR
jgi:hypothetical protein